jgi:hypothetical protein
VTADEWEARVRYAEGDHRRVLAIAAAFPDSALDDRGVVVGRRGRLAALEILSLFALGRHGEAAHRLRACLRDNQLPLGLPDVKSVLDAAGSGVGEVAALFTADGLRGLLLATAEVPDAVADELLEALWQRHPGDAGVLAVAARIGGRLALSRAMEWSIRLRQDGFAAHCTLVSLAGSAGRAPRERVLAAALCVELFSDPRAAAQLAAALDALPGDEAAAVLEQIRLLAPGVAATAEPSVAAE